MPAETWTPKRSLDMSETIDGINYRPVKNGEDAKRVVDSFFVPFLLGKARRLLRSANILCYI
jgi:hypothetical protein